MTNLSERIDDLFAKDNWSKARRLIERELQKTPDDHWLLARLATTFYEERQYEKSLELLDRARSLAPNCPLVLWEWAGTLQMIGQTQEALNVYSQLLKKNVATLAGDECGEGEEWAIALLADCLFRVATCWSDLGNTDCSLPYLFRCLEVKALGAGGIYSKREVEKEINRLTKAKRSSYLEQKLEDVQAEISLC